MGVHTCRDADAIISVRRMTRMPQDSGRPLGTKREPVTLGECSGVGERAFSLRARWTLQALRDA